MSAITIAEKQAVVQSLGFSNRRRHFVRPIPRDIVEFDGLLAGRKSVTTDLQRIEDGRVTDDVADHLIQGASIGVSNAIGSGLAGRQAGQIARRALSMDV